MKLSELSEHVSVGKFVNSDNLTSVPNNYLYLTPANIKNNLITEEGAKYIIDRTGRKFLKSDSLSYGDIVIYRKSDDDFSIFRFTQELNKSVIPSQFLIVIKSPNSFLSNTLQTESGKGYVKSEIQDLWKHKEGNWRNVMSEIKNIDMPTIFEDGEISIPPGSIPVEKSDLPKISIRKGLISNDNLIKRVSLNEIRISGYFQRKSKLWSNGTKSRLIETIILDIPIPPLYFDVVSKKEWLIVDGLQRISAIHEFVEDKFPLEGLDFFPEYNSLKFSMLDHDIKRSILEAELTIFAIQPGTPRTVRYKIFKNINTSALILTRQEIRHAMNEDEAIVGFTPSRYVEELSKILNKHVDISEAEIDRMADRELALRYVTFRMFFYKSEYRPNMPDFLDFAMDNMFSYPKNKLEIYKSEFDTILQTLIDIFGKSFLFTRKMIASKEEDDNRNQINGALLEIWTYAISTLSPMNLQKLVKRADIVKFRTRDLGTDNNFLRSIDNRYSNNIESVKIRFATIINLVNDVINDN